MDMKKTKIAHNFFEEKAWAENHYVCGIDEVGRGALAGPLVVAAAILVPNMKHPLLKDSKVLTQEQREEAYTWLVEHNNSMHSIVTVSHNVIDKINIYQATIRAMRKAFMHIVECNHIATTNILSPFALRSPTKSKAKTGISKGTINSLKYVISDAVPLRMSDSYRHANLEFYSPNFAESISSSVAAASIIAKVTRDRLMTKLTRYFPGFNFDTHKGYGTKSHKQALALYGPSVIHRKTFLTKIKERAKSHEQQSALF